MSSDLANPSIRATVKRNRIPAFQKLESVLESIHASQDLAQIASEFILDGLDRSQNLKADLDAALDLSIKELLRGLPHESFSYRYLALSSDFNQLRTLCLEAYGSSGERLKERLRQESKSLLCKSWYEAELNGLLQKMHIYPNAFEWVMAIDRLYLKYLKEFASSSDEWNQQFLARKIDTYNVSSWYRLQSFGKKIENLHEYFLSNPKGLSFNSLNRPTIDALVSKVTKTNVSDVSPETVELAMRLREIQFARSSVFQGYGESVVLFYSEILKAFFYNLKLLAIYEQLSSDKEDVRRHLLNYDLK